MNAYTSTQATEVQQIEAAMDALLKVCTDRSAPKPPSERSERFMLTSMADFMREEAEKQTWTKAHRGADKLLADPVGTACRQAIRTLAERLYEIGGMQALEDACERVADMDPAFWGWRTDIMDKRFNGIGFENGQIGWVC